MTQIGGDHDNDDMIDDADDIADESAQAAPDDVIESIKTSTRTNDFSNGITDQSKHARISSNRTVPDLFPTVPRSGITLQAHDRLDKSKTLPARKQVIKIPAKNKLAIFTLVTIPCMAAFSPGSITVGYCPTKEMIVDVFDKPLQVSMLYKLRAEVVIIPPPAQGPIVASDSTLSSQSEEECVGANGQGPAISLTLGGLMQFLSAEIRQSLTTNHTSGHSLQ
jgi:hypothetical protein